MDQSENRFYREKSDATADGGPAFPCHTNPRPGSLNEAPQGMTLRDYFAAKAMEGLIASYAGMHIDPLAALTIDKSALACYAMADAMIRARGAV